MEIGLQTGGLEEHLGREVTLKMAAEAGFQTLDFNINNDISLAALREGDRSSILLQSEEEVLAYYAPFRDMVQTNGLRVEQMHAPFPTYQTDPEIQELIVLSIKRSIAVAGMLGCPYIIVHPAHLGFDVDMSRAETFEANKRLFDQLFEDLERHNVQACLENMFRRWRGKLLASACAHPYEALEYVNALNEMAGAKRVSFCLDTGHNLLTGLDIYQSILDLAPILTTLHVHDNDGLNDQHRMPWKGVIDWERFTRGLREINYQGVLSFETFAEFVAQPKELIPEILQLKAAMGRYFVKEIKGE